ncbi:shikimate dehydrogenase [Chryseomicrobium palamuruense]|uniref:Shikimate dehydrogenase (NADP(+)) n=1 Tax=Chryseomicrobium palamuruense TaxID=682973 RepID=A0ABV8UXM5_9BACL
MKKWYAVLGHPIHHSISPRMHEAWFQKYNIEASYVPILVKPGELEKAVDSLKLLGCSGFNVTVPYKEEIIPFLNELDVSAKVAGAVNTVVNRDGQLIGHNTDGRGLLANISGLSEEKRVLVIGAGGAAKGIVAALKERHIRTLFIANRTLEKAVQLAEWASGTAITYSQAEDMFSTFDIVIQTTSVGMEEDISPVNLKGWHPSMTAIDIIYSPPETAFLRQAREEGAFTMNGLSMLIGQGALAFELWTGIYPDQDYCKKTVFSS